jgi:hypothetical protein
MDAIRQYFVLNRIQNGACEFHLRPTSITLGADLKAEWGEVVAPITKKRAARADNVESSREDLIAELDAAVDLDPFEGHAEERQEVETLRAQVAEMETEEVKEAKAAKRKGKKVDMNYTTPADACVCGCQNAVYAGYRNRAAGDYTSAYKPRGNCIFAAGRCGCGCEDKLTDEVWRQARLEQTMEQTDEGWNTWDQEPDPQICRWLRDRYFLDRDIVRLEADIAGRPNVNPALEARLKKWQTRIYTVDQRIARRRERNQAEQNKSFADDDAEEPEMPAPVFSGQYTLQDITESTLSREALIDGMCTAVQRCHALRILHRNIRLENFAVQHYIDQAGEDAVPNYTTEADGNVAWGERPDGSKTYLQRCKLEELPRHRPVVVLRGWEHACFNPGNTAFKNSKRNTFAFPEWGETAPEMSGDMPKRLEYGFEYDMWCLGLCIFELMYATSLTDEVDPAEFTNAWLERWIAEHPLERNGAELLPNASLYQILLGVILTTDAGKRACSYAAMNMTDGPRSVLFDRQMEVLNEAPTPERFAKKFPLAPPIGKMLSGWLVGTRSTEDARRAARKIDRAAREAERVQEEIDMAARNRDRQERRDAPEKARLARLARNEEREERRAAIDDEDSDEEVSDDEESDEDEDEEDVSSDEEPDDETDDETDESDNEDDSKPTAAGDAFLELLRDHDYTPRRNTPPGVHWGGCLCDECLVRPRPPVIDVDDKVPEARTERTRVMYAMMAASQANHDKIPGHQLILIYSQLADAVLGDTSTPRIDLERWGFSGEREFRKMLTECARGLQALRIRL